MAVPGALSPIRNCIKINDFRSDGSRYQLGNSLKLTVPAKQLASQRLRELLATGTLGSGQLSSI
jgi:hypothetical protein